MEKCQAGTGAGNKRKKEKGEQTFHVCSSNASKGNLYLRINDSWATFYYLANSKRAMYLLEEEKMVFSFGVKNPHFLPVTCLLSSVIHLTHRASTPCALHTLSWRPWLSVQHQYRSGPAWAAKASPIVFPEYGNRICGCNPGLSPFSERMFCLKINGTVTKL